MLCYIFQCAFNLLHKAEGNQPCQQALAEQLCLQIEFWCGWAWIEAFATDENSNFRQFQYGQMEKQRRKNQSRERQKLEDPGAAKRYNFQCILWQKGQKVGSLKRRVQSHLARCMHVARTKFPSQHFKMLKCLGFGALVAARAIVSRSK